MKQSLAVGVIGIGAMGMGVAKTLLRAGFSVRVRDIRPEADAEARAAGAIVCTSAAELAAGSAVVISVVVDSAQTDEVVFGRDGAAQALTTGGVFTDGVFIMCSTVAPDYSESLAARLAARGLAMLDAPISGGPARAHAGTLSMMLAGPAAALTRCATVLEAVADRRFVISARAGDGSRAKIVNNMLAGVNLAAACEAMALGLKLGLEAATLHQVVCASSGGSWMFSDRMPRVLAGDYAPRAALKILTKDLSLLLDAAREAGCPAELAATAHRAYAAALAQGFGGEDDAALVKHYAALAGVALPAAVA
ncbi:MAG: NAD(P)-dependent oxidoreductase [Betaproteobacteria bacterium]